MIHYIEEDRINEQIVLNSERIMLLDVSADWCIPCQMIAPILTELDKKYHNIEIFRVNADECSNFIVTNNISAIPTIIVYANGEEKERIVGLQSLTKLSNIVDAYSNYDD